MQQNKPENAAKAKTDCFIMMPITTPDQFLPRYRNDPSHFTHVLECLFIPAIEKAGFNPVPPKVKGSGVIHADIIKKLETKEFVLSITKIRINLKMKRVLFFN